MPLSNTGPGRKWPWVVGACPGHSSGRALLGWTRFGSPGIFG